MTAGRRSLSLLSAAIATAILVGAACCSDATFTDPDSILRWYAAPLGVLLVSLALLGLRPSARLAVASVLLTLASFEAGARILAAVGTDPAVETSDQPYFHPDPDLGYAATPQVQTRTQRLVGDELIYDVEYSFDEHGRRLTPGSEANQRFVLCFGGSFMFGEGLPDTDTLPTRIAARAAGVTAYNYAFRGYGPPQLLALLEQGGLRAEIREPEGALLYLFMDAHVQRAVGSLRVHAGWAHATPLYIPGADGRPTRRGSLTTGRPMTALLYALLGRSALFQATGLDLPSIGPTQLQHSVEIIARSAELFSAQFGPQPFVVAIYPGSQHAQALRRDLPARGVRVLDYSTLFDQADPRYRIPGDGHPSAYANEALATGVVADLGLDASSP